MTSTMTSTAFVQGLYQAFGRADVEYILARIAPDCRWVAAGEGIPASGSYTGPQGVAEFFTKLAETETILRFEPREYFVNREDVVALGFEECRINSTGKTASTNWAMLFRVHGGKVVYFETFFNTAAFALAHR